MAAFRALLVVLLSLVLVALGASLSHLVAGGAFSLALAVPVVVWLGMDAGLVEGAVAAAAVGVVTDAAAGGPMGLLTFLSVMAFLGTRAASSAIDARGVLAFAVLSGAATLLMGIGALLLTRYVSPPEAAPRWGLMGRVAGEALLTAVLAPAVGWMLKRVLGAAPREQPGVL